MQMLLAFLRDFSSPSNSALWVIEQKVLGSLGQGLLTLMVVRQNTTHVFFLVVDNYIIGFLTAGVVQEK